MRDPMETTRDDDLTPAELEDQFDRLADQQYFDLAVALAREAARLAIRAELDDDGNNDHPF